MDTKINDLVRNTPDQICSHNTAKKIDIYHKFKRSIDVIITSCVYDAHYQITQAHVDIHMLTR